MYVDQYCLTSNPFIDPISGRHIVGSPFYAGYGQLFQSTVILSVTSLTKDLLVILPF